VPLRLDSPGSSRSLPSDGVFVVDRDDATGSPSYPRPAGTDRVSAGDVSQTRRLEAVRNRSELLAGAGWGKNGGMMYGARWYDMDGNELHDMAAVEALMGDIDRRRVALTDFDGRAEVSTVLLVLDHNWGGGPPLIFETMVFMDTGTFCERTSSRTAALAMHDQACADVREALARFDAEVARMERATVDDPATRPAARRARRRPRPSM